MFSHLKQTLTQRKRRRLADQCNSEALRECLDAPLPALNTDAADVDFLVFDLEMSGLNPKQDVILSIGYVPIVARRIVVADAAHEYVFQANADLNTTAPIHNIRHQELAQGVELRHALERFLQAARGRVLVAHHARIDLVFLNKALQEQYGAELVTYTIDTLNVERKRRANESLDSKAFRLHACCERYNLPANTAHNALSDALATAQLWLAQLSHARSGSKIALSYFVE